jgi:hypothetical protein
MPTKIRKSILVLLAAGGLLLGGFWTGRLIAGSQWGYLGLVAAHHFDHMAGKFDHIAKWLTLSDSQKAELKQVVRSHREEILSQIQSHMDAQKALGELIPAGTVDEELVRERAEELGRVVADGPCLKHGSTQKSGLF